MVRLLELAGLDPDDWGSRSAKKASMVRSLVFVDAVEYKWRRVAVEESG